MALFTSKTADRPEKGTVRQTGIPSNQINMIGEGTVLEGAIESGGDFRISGRIVGRVRVAGKVIVAQEGVVEGELRASSADVAGRVHGEVHVVERLLIRSTGSVEGDVFTSRLIVEEGGMLEGNCKMVGEVPASSEATKATDSNSEEGSGASMNLREAV
jgi:cytoskeletal protein CcmA (bactofilin family)